MANAGIPAFSLEQKRQWMERCIELAYTAPGGIGKPHVGAVVVSREGVVLGEGYRSLLQGTRRLQRHAERMALDAAGVRTRGATLVTTLEPCVRIRRGQLFKSCSELIAENGIERVIYGLSERNPVHDLSGKGIRYLQRAGVFLEQYPDLNSIICERLQPKGTSDEK